MNKLPQIELKGDADIDADKYGHEPDTEGEPIGPLASSSDARVISALVKRYYAAAEAEDGATGCRLLYRVLAEAEPGDYGSAPAPPGLHDKECAAVMSGLFKQTHRQTSAYDAGLRVTFVRVNLNKGAVQFDSYGRKPYHYIGVFRERGTWKIDMLLGTERPIHTE